MKKTKFAPDHILYYFVTETRTLPVVVITGLFYNIGMAFVPWFEGQLTQRLCDILGGTKPANSMAGLAIIYLLTVLFVQFGRYEKRLYVRKFANNIGKKMKLSIYRNILKNAEPEESNAEVGNLMTKAISDAETVADGVRKFTTELFDTGVLIVSYMVLLLGYDWRLALISMIFTPIAYLAAGRMKTVVTRYTAAYKESMSKLNTDTLERVSNAMTYRVYGLENTRNEKYEEMLKDFEKKAIFSNIWESSMQPLYQVISLVGVMFVIYFGARNVMGTGWTQWDIAAFSAFLSCFTRLAHKSSRSARLFNRVQKAVVSWKRIQGYLKEISEESVGALPEKDQTLIAQNVSFAYGQNEPVVQDLNLTIKPGEIVGITGEVACGKTTLGKLFLCEKEHQGKIFYDGERLEKLVQENAPVCAYLGHQLELFQGSIRNNICLGQEGDVLEVLRDVCMDEEVLAFEHGVDTLIGDGGVRLSGGQQARIALARTLFHQRPILILDDPFSAVDQTTEKQIFSNIRAHYPEKIILLMSHRLVLFPQMDQVVFMEDGRSIVSTHEELLKTNTNYRRLYEIQTGGDTNAK